MSLLTRRRAARTPRGLRSAFDAGRTFLVTAIARARAWQWGAVVGRITVAALGLVLLGAIGRSALAHTVLSTDPSPLLDAGAANMTPSPVPSTPAAVSLAPSSPTPSLAVAAPTASIAAPEASRGHATPDDPVFLNQATLADLHRLPGVGPKRAEAILSLRAKLGHFRQIEDLLKVKGIGRSSLRKLRPLVRLNPPPAKAQEALDAAIAG